MSKPQPDNTQRTFSYRIDGNNVIVSMSPDCAVFAEENDTSKESIAALVGRGLLECFADDATRGIYTMLIDKVRETGKSITVPLRCDSPDRRRFSKLSISREAENILFSSHIYKEEFREPVLLLQSGLARSDEFLTICGWCKKLSVEGVWVEVEEALLGLDLLSDDKFPNLTHGICSDCKAVYFDLESESASDLSNA